MAVGVGASGFVGFAPETVSGTYQAPTIYSLLRNEGMQHEQDTKWRRPLRGIADVAGAVAGSSHVEGDIEIEVTEDELVYWLKGARGATVKTGAGPYLYTFTPNAVAVPTSTISITVVRNGIAFGYVGCIVGGIKVSIDEGTLIAVLSITGNKEASATLPTPTYPSQIPFGMGQYRLEIPTATQVFDADTFELTINDNPEPQYRLKDTDTAAQFNKFGERSVELAINRDFETRTDYDAFKVLTAQSITLKCTKSVNQYVQFKVPASVKDSYEIEGLSGQAELIRAKISYQGVYDAGTSKAYEIVISTATNIL